MNARFSPPVQRLAPGQTTLCQDTPHTILHRQRREMLAEGKAGQWYSLMGEIYHPGDPLKARQYYEKKLDEELANHAHRLFIDGTALPRVETEREDWV